MIVIAHRGAWGDAPENTLPAFERASSSVPTTSSSTCTPTATAVSSSRTTRRSAGRSYPSLEEALDLMRGRIGVMVELKAPARYRRHDVVARTVELLTDADAVVCFQRAALDEVRALRPQLRTVQHVGFAVSIRAARTAWAAGFHDQRVTRRGIRAALGLGLVPLVYTVNDERRMHELAGAGVGGIFTDRPERALRLFREDRP